MPSRIEIINTEPASKIAGGAATPIRVKQTGGGPARELDLPPGGRVEVLVGEGQKVTIHQGGEEE